MQKNRSMPAPRLRLAFAMVGSLALATAILAPGAFGRTFSASADAYVKSSKPTANFGGGRFVRAGRSRAVRGYARFRVHARDPIVGARLHLFVAKGSAHRIRAQRVSNGWREGEIKWTRQPHVVGRKVAYGGPARRGRWVEIDVSSIVRRSGTYSFRFSARKAHGIALSSRNAGHARRSSRTKTHSSKPPRLEITTPPLNTQPPGVSGTTAVGSTLTATSGSWRGSTPLSLAYQWRRCSGGVCSIVAGANSAGYLLTSDDLGATLLVSVTASNSVGSATAASAETAVVTTPPSIQPPGSALIWSADHETGDMSQWPKATVSWDDSGCTNHDISNEHARSGAYSLKLTIDIPAGGKAGCRQARMNEIQSGNTYVYEASYFLPEPVLTLTNHWNVFQFKSRCATCTSSDPIWTIDFQGNPLRPVLQWKGGTYGLAGPQNADGITGQIEYPNLLTTTPVGQWTTLTVYLDQSKDYDGRIIVWHDGIKLYDIAGIRTEYPSLDARWSVNNYSNGLSVNPYTLFIDDAAIHAP